MFAQLLIRHASRNSIKNPFPLQLFKHNGFVKQPVRGLGKRVLRPIYGDLGSRLFWKNLKFYFLLGFVPTVSLITLVNMNSGEIIICEYDPDVYQPKKHEYYSHPIQRWFATKAPSEEVKYFKHIYKLEQIDHEGKTRKLIKQVHHLQKVLSGEVSVSSQPWNDTFAQNETIQREIRDYIEKENLEFAKDYDEE